MRRGKRYNGEKQLNLKNSKQKHLAGFINGVLRNVLRTGIKLPEDNNITSLSIRYSCPEWIVKSFMDDYGLQDAVVLLEASLQPPPVIIRVNTLKTTVDDLKDILSKENITVKLTNVDNALEIIGGIDITKSQAYQDGLFHVQDTASQIVVNRLSPKFNERVLDVCAAPGGKTFTMANVPAQATRP